MEGREAREASLFSFAAKLGNQGGARGMGGEAAPRGRAQVYCFWWVYRYLDMRAGEALGNCQHVEGI